MEWFLRELTRTLIRAGFGALRRRKKTGRGRNSPSVAAVGRGAVLRDAVATSTVKPYRPPQRLDHRAPEPTQEQYTKFERERSEGFYDRDSRLIADRHGRLAVQGPDGSIEEMDAARRRLQGEATGKTLEPLNETARVVARRSQAMRKFKPDYSKVGGRHDIRGGNAENTGQFSSDGSRRGEVEIATDEG